MKPVLYWTLRGSLYAETTDRFKPFAVTSEGPRGRINGRFEDGFVSHCTVEDIHGRFDTLEKARAKVKALTQLFQRYSEQIIPLRDKIKELDRARRAELKKVLQS